MTAADLLSIWITETMGHDVDSCRPSLEQFQTWLDTYGEIALVGVRNGTRGYIWKYGGTGNNTERAYHMINYIGKTLENLQHELMLRKKRIARRAAKKAAHGIS